MTRTGVEADAGQPKDLAAEDPQKTADDEQRQDGEESEVDDPSHGCSLAAGGREREAAYAATDRAPGPRRLGAGGANLGDGGKGRRDGRPALPRRLTVYMAESGAWRMRSKLVVAELTRAACDGQADRGAHGHARAPDPEGDRHRAQDAIGDQGRLGTIGQILEQDRELVAVQPRSRVPGRVV